MESPIIADSDSVITSEPREKWNAKMIISTIQMILGLGAFFGFIVFANYYAAAWGFFSFVLALFAFNLHFHDNKNQLSEKYTPEDLDSEQFIGLIGFMLGLTGIIWNIFAMEYYNLHVTPISTSPVIQMVWAFMTMKNGLLLIIYTYRYKIKLDNP